VLMSRDGIDGVAGLQLSCGRLTMIGCERGRTCSVGWIVFHRVFDVNEYLKLFKEIVFRVAVAWGPTHIKSILTICVTVIQNKSLEALSISRTMTKARTSQIYSQLYHTMDATHISNTQK